MAIDAASIVDALDLVSIDEFASLSGAERDRAFLHVERMIRGLQAHKLAMITVVETTGSYVDDGHRNIFGWTQAVTNTSGSAAQRDVHNARMLAELPQLAAALCDGAIGDAQLAPMRRLHRNRLCRQHMPDADTLMTENARTLIAHDFGLVCQRFNAHADPDGQLVDHDRTRNQRSVSIAIDDTSFRLTATGDATSGKRLLELIDSRLQRETDIDYAERQRTYGDHALAYTLARNTRQRRFDAFVNLLVDGAIHSLTGHAPKAAGLPTINIICTETSLTNALHHTIGTTRTPRAGPTTNPSNDPDTFTPWLDPRLHLSETDTGTPINERDLVIAALIGHIRSVIVDSTGRVTNLGRRRRLFTGAARDAILLAGKHCSFPGCTITGNHIQIDHLTPWTALQGTTTIDNGGPLCGVHNRTRHTNNHTTTRDHTGWHHHRPDNTEITPRDTRGEPTGEP